MPKQVGHCTIVVASVLALGFAGCRTATSRLASIPGMGWVDRGEKSFGEGWADYEPAPELPPPSATSEPIEVDASCFDMGDLEDPVDRTEARPVDPAPSPEGLLVVEMKGQAAVRLLLRQPHQHAGGEAVGG